MARDVTRPEIRRCLQLVRVARNSVVVKDSDDLPPLMLHPRPIVLEDDQQIFPRTVHRTSPQRMCTPEIAREMIKRWISLVPSKIV